MAQAPQAVPANEPAAITRLRGMLGPRTRLTYATAQELDTAGENVRMTGVVLEQGTKRATADEVTVNGLREDGVAEAVLRGFATREGRTEVRFAMLRIAGLTVPRGAGGPPQPDQVRLEELRLEGLNTSGEANIRLTLATVNNWIAGQPGRFAIQGLEMSGLDAGFADAFRLDRAVIAGVDVATILGAVMRGDAPPNLMGNSSLELDRLELTGNGRPVGGLDELRMAATVTQANGSGTGTLAFRGIRVEPIPVLSQWLTNFGYQAINAEITAATTYDAATGRVDLSDLTIAGQDVGRLSFALTMDGLTQARMQASDFSAARLIGMRLTYADNSLFGRFIAMQSRQSRTPEPQLREQFAQMAGGAITQPGAAGLDPIRDAVQRFIRGQAQTVQINVNPPRPVGMADVQGAPPSPADAQRMFGITAEAR